MSKPLTIVARAVFLDGIKKTRISFSVETGLILSVETTDVSPNANDDYIFNDDCLLFPGMGDIHIHAREDVSFKNVYKEDFTSACCAAINGAVVHIADMPNNPVPPIDENSYREKVLLAQKVPLPILMYAGVGPHTSPLSYKVPYKAFMGPSIGDLFFSSNAELESAISKYRGLWVSFHCEDPEVLESHKSFTDHFSRRPIIAENLATEFALELIEKYQLRDKLCHYSSGAGLDAIIKARQKGVQVQIEVTPQHLFFSEEKIKNEYQHIEHYFQMNPPIRFEADRLKMLAALKNGDIDFLATDHAPHSKEEKEKGTSGMPGLDTYGLFVTWLLNENQFDPVTILKCTAYNPGKFINEFLPGLSALYPQYKKFGLGFGELKPHFSASFSILNLKKPTTFQSHQMASKAHWSPFDGFQFSGSIAAVFVQGKLVKTDH